MADLVFSKVAAGATLLLLSCLGALPPNTLSESKGDKGKDKYFKAGSFTGAKICSGICTIAALVVLVDDRIGIRNLRKPWSTVDVVCTLLGVLGSMLRLWSMRTLKKFFTFEVGIVKGHRLVQTGPYRIIRHPSYTGGILSFIGTYGILGLHPASLAFWLIVGLPLTALIVLRIRNEEEALHQHFGKEWERHCKRTWRLLPPLY